MRLSHTHSHYWVFIKQSDRPDYQDLHSSKPSRPCTHAALPSELFHANTAQSRREEVEATLLPKLKVHFAEFPNLTFTCHARGC